MQYVCFFTRADSHQYEWVHDNWTAHPSLLMCMEWGRGADWLYTD